MKLNIGLRHPCNRIKHNFSLEYGLRSFNKTQWKPPLLLSSTINKISNLIYQTKIPTWTDQTQFWRMFYIKYNANLVYKSGTSSASSGYNLVCSVHVSVFLSCLSSFSIHLFCCLLVLLPVLLRWFRRRLLVWLVVPLPWWRHHHHWLLRLHQCCPLMPRGPPQWFGYRPGSYHHHSRQL